MDQAALFGPVMAVIQSISSTCDDTETQRMRESQSNSQSGEWRSVKKKR